MLFEVGESNEFKQKYGKSVFIVFRLCLSGLVFFSIEACLVAL